MISIARRRIPLLAKGDYVDLGLPSGLLWDTKNIGASDETDYGLYFSWGEKKGYVDAKSKTNRDYTGFIWGSYEHITGTSGQASALTKYNSSDGKTVLDLTDDAAHVIMGCNWRMPTLEEFQELTANTTSTWKTNYNGTSVSGRLFTSNSNPNIKLFFPAAGNCQEETIYSNGSVGSYWSSSLATSDRLSGRYLGFSSSNVYTNYQGRYGGLSVRGVFTKLPGRDFIDDYEYVDLGLPSGLKWATCNVGASSETEYGNYYKYGSGATQYSANTDESSYYKGTENPLSSSRDTARQVMGGSWRMPTRAEFRELRDNTTYTYTTINGVSGGKFSKTVDGKERYVFFPAAGYYSKGSLYSNTGRIWSSTPGNSSNASGLNVGSGYDNLNSNSRYFGQSVRGVHE